MSMRDGSGPGKLEAIWIKPARGAPMDPVPQARLIANHGLDGNANVGGKRQVTLLEREVWERIMKEMSAGLDPAARRANLLVSRFPLAGTRNRILRVGKCRIRIRGETSPCHQMDAALPGLRQALDENWHGGAYGVVLDDGTISLGDDLTWEI
ncbi:MAG: MOSC domain-containing protein [Acidobacteria bacterium]|nr:MOSC domain-containing protein [Acidobacteriota bacterium]